MTFRALFGSELRRLTARRVVPWSLAVASLLAVVVVVINTLRSTGTGFGDHTMYLRKIWLEGPDGVRETALLADRGLPDGPGGRARGDGDRWRLPRRDGRHAVDLGAAAASG